MTGRHGCDGQIWPRFRVRKLVRECRGVVKEERPSRTGAPASSKTHATSTEQKNARSVFSGMALFAAPAVPTAQKLRLIPHPKAASKNMADLPSVLALIVEQLG
jgi:hypothetical protein